jgi:hypothetical protein
VHSVILVSVLTTVWGTGWRALQYRSFAADARAVRRIVGAHRVRDAAVGLEGGLNLGSIGSAPDVAHNRFSAIFLLSKTVTR